MHIARMLLFSAFLLVSGTFFFTTLFPYGVDGIEIAMVESLEKEGEKEEKEEKETSNEDDCIKRGLHTHSPVLAIATIETNKFGFWQNCYSDILNPPPENV